MSATDHASVVRAALRSYWRQGQDITSQPDEALAALDALVAERDAAVAALRKVVDELAVILHAGRRRTEGSSMACSNE